MAAAKKVKVKRKKGASSERSRETENSLKPRLSDEEVEEQNKRFFTVLGVTAFVVVTLFIVLQFV